MKTENTPTAEFNLNQLRAEINHILDSGANDLRLIELFSRLNSKKDKRIAELERGIECFNRSEANLRESVHSRDKQIQELKEEVERLKDKSCPNCLSDNIADVCRKCGQRF